MSFPSSHFWLLLRPHALCRELRAFLTYARCAYRFSWARVCSAPPDGPVVLFVNFSNWIPRATLDGILATALRLRGFDPVILTNREYAWSRRYLRLFGVRRFLYFDDLLREAEAVMGEMDVERLLREHGSFAGLYTFTREGIGVGRHVLSTVVRQRKVGSLAFSDPVVTAMLREFLPLSLKAARAAALLFDRVSPKAVLFLEKGYTPYGEIFDAALQRNLNVIQYFHGHRSDLLVMKRFHQGNRFQHPFALSAQSWERVRKLPWGSEQEERFMAELRRSYEEGTWMNRKFLLRGKKLKEPSDVRAQLGLDPAKKTAVIFSHVLWDATFFFGENLFPDYEQWLIATVKAACENSRVNWIIKLHPDYTWKTGGEARDTVALETGVGTLPAHVHLVLPATDISTYSFFGITDYCVTVRGTIGIEAPCFGIRTFTAGTGRYSGLGFTEDSRTAEEYLAKIRRIEEFPRLTPEETSLARRHASALFTLRPLPFTSCEIKPKEGSASFEQEAIVRVRSLADLRKASDLNAFWDWVLESQEEDYLHLPAS